MQAEIPVVAVLPQEGSDPRCGLEALEGDAELRVAHDAASLASALAEASVLLVWDFRTDWLRAAWSSAGGLQWVHTASAGVDAILVPELVDNDIVLTNSRGVFDRPIAEYVLGTLLMFAKDLHTSLALQRERRWEHRETDRLDGRRAVVIGVGGIGRATGRLLQAAGMHVTGVGRRARPGDADFGEIVGADQLLDVLATADAVVVAAPLTPDTRAMIDARCFEALQPGTWLVNVGRGPVVDEAALVQALRTGQVGAAALDVFETEPLPADSPLWELGNVLVTPHMSGDFRGWDRALGELFVDNFGRWRAGEPLRNVVDKQRGYVPG